MQTVDGERHGRAEDDPQQVRAVDEAREAGIEQLIFVTGRGKSALVDYFDQAFELAYARW